jgi:hypothetical protein
MTLEDLQAEELAREWTMRVVARMKDSGLPEEEMDETAFIIFQLTQVAVNALKADPVIKIPKVKQELTVDGEQALLVLDLFIRGVSSMAKVLRDIDEPAKIPWDDRKVILEQVAWETFIMAKVLVAGFYLPTPINNSLKAEGDLRVVMNQSILEILKPHLPKGSVIKKATVANLPPEHMSIHTITYQQAAALSKSAEVHDE